MWERQTRRRRYASRQARAKRQPSRDCLSDYPNTIIYPRLSANLFNQCGSGYHPAISPFDLKKSSTGVSPVEHSDTAGTAVLHFKSGTGAFACVPKVAQASRLWNILTQPGRLCYISRVAQASRLWNHTVPTRRGLCYIPVARHETQLSRPPSQV